MGQAIQATDQYRGCIGQREDRVADRILVRPANWGPRAVWDRVLARAS